MKTASLWGFRAGAGVLGVALALASAMAMAQGTGGQQGAPPAQTAPKTAVDVGDKELSQFADAVLALQQIKQGYDKKLGQAANKEEAQQIQGKMQQEMRQAIKDKGLSIQRYSKIGQALQNDPQLKKRVNKLIQKR